MTGRAAWQLPLPALASCLSVGELPELSLPGARAERGPIDPSSLPVTIAYAEEFARMPGTAPSPGRGPIDRILSEWNEALEGVTFFEVPAPATANKEYDEDSLGSEVPVEPDAMDAIERALARTRALHGARAETRRRIYLAYLLDGENGIYQRHGWFPASFPEDPYGAIAIIGKNPLTGEANLDIIFNYKNYRWNPNLLHHRKYGVVDFSSSLRHEIGHLLGLPHADVRDEGNVMFNEMDEHHEETGPITEKIVSPRDRRLLEELYRARGD